MADYDRLIMSDDDYKKKQEYVNAYKNATTKAERDAAHQQAEQLRSKYGYTGGQTGADVSYTYGQNVTNSLSNLIKNNEQQAAAMEAAKNVQAQSYDEQVKRAKQQSETALREAYIKNLQNQSGLDQQLRASGVTGGAAESTRSAMLNNYMKTRADLQNAAGQTIKDIELDRASALANYDLQKANADANFNATYADYIQNADNNAYNRKIQDENMEITRQQLEQDRLNTAYERALALIDSGLVDDRNIGSIADTLGLEQGTIKAYIDRLNAQAVSSSGSGGSRSGSSGSSSAGSDSTAADEQSANNESTAYDLFLAMSGNEKTADEVTAIYNNLITAKNDSGKNVNNESTKMPTQSEVITGILMDNMSADIVNAAMLYGIDVDRLTTEFEKAAEQNKLNEFFNNLEKNDIDTSQLKRVFLG